MISSELNRKFVFTGRNVTTALAAASIALLMRPEIAIAAGAKADRYGEAKAESRTSPRAEAPTEMRTTESGLKFAAFVDVEGRLSSESTLPTRGFTLNEGALMLSKDFDHAHAVVDLPFSSDLTGTNNSFIFAHDIAQAYVAVDRWTPMTFTLGQYETFFGVERNSSPERFFANVGLIKQYLLPNTHTGFQAAYRLTNLTLRAQLTDPNGNGSLAQNNPEAALDGRFETDGKYFAAGLSFNQSPASSVNGTTNLLVELTGGAAVDKLHFDGELTVRQVPTTTKTAVGVGAHARLAFNEAIDFGGRLEYLSNPFVTTLGTNGGTYDSALEFTVGPSYRLQKDVRVRGDLSVVNAAVSGTTDTNFVGSLSVIAEL